jgi:HAD superfamily hydrolase (TIGR01484 family)
MRPLAEMPRAMAANVTALFTDIDDTLTTEGRLTPPAYAALGELRDAGIRVIPVTGRPAGWCDMIARFWPVDGVVGENGAFYFRYDHGRRQMRRRYFADRETMAANRSRLASLADVISRAVPGAAIASDQEFRVADLAIDFREDVTPLPASAVDEIVRLFQEAGAVAKVSSIHVNGWFGHYDKLSMTKTMLESEFGTSLDEAGERLVYAGDSPNDEPMFQAFPLSIGVANVRDFAARMRALPAYVTRLRSGEGFVELARHLIGARQP